MAEFEFEFAAICILDRWDIDVSFKGLLKNDVGQSLMYDTREKRCKNLTLHF